MHTKVQRVWELFWLMIAMGAVLAGGIGCMLGQEGGHPPWQLLLLASVVLALLSISISVLMVYFAIVDGSQRARGPASSEDPKSMSESALSAPSVIITDTI